MEITKIRNELKKELESGNKIVFFGGAGVSTDSGIPDFRSSNGIYSEKYGRISPEEIVSHDFFVRDPKLFYKFYFEKLFYPEAKPNSTHIALAKAEKRGGNITIVTQNIDGLHQEAGSGRVYELHGGTDRLICQSCGDIVKTKNIEFNGEIPYCKKCGGILKPDVVLYGEGLDDEVVSGAIRSISEAEILIVAGTSLVVYPAAGFIGYFRGNKIYIINKTYLPLQSSEGKEIVQANVALGEIFDGMY